MEGLIGKPRVAASYLRLLTAVLALAAVLACGEEAPEGTASPLALAEKSASATPSPTLGPTASARLSIIGGGDVMLGRSIADGINQNGPLWPFEGILDVLRGSDIAFVNLESPLTDGGEPADKDFVFRGPLAGARGLKDAGVDVVTLGNNHVLDYGLTGLRDTWAALEAAGLPQTGSGENETAARTAAVLERNGLRIAFLGYVNTPADSVSGFVVEDTKATADRAGVAWLSPQAIAEDVAKAKGQADLVVVAFQAGVEYSEAPIALQVESAHAAIDAGASVVFGHHPHVLQGIETYKGGVIIYSLGNLVFDFDFVDYMYPGLPNALTGMLRVELSRDGVVGCEFVPMIVGEADGRPRRVTGAEAAPVLERMRRLSDGSCGLE